MESYRKQDMKAENALGEFMNTSFYSKLQDEQGNKIFYERKTDEKSQKEGLDVVIEVHGKRFLIDEKASFYYSNLMIPTFAFEVNSMQKFSDNPIRGWLLNDELKTEYYMLIWPNIKCQREGDEKPGEKIPLERLTPNDFTIVEAMLIKKKRILDYLADYNWTKDRIWNYAEKIRHIGKEGKFPVKESKHFYFFYTKNLAELPINIVIKKSTLKELALQSYFISREYYGEVTR